MFRVIARVVVALTVALCLLTFGAMSSPAFAGNLWQVELPAIRGDIWDIAVGDDGSIFVFELRKTGRTLPRNSHVIHKLTAAGTEVWQQTLPAQFFEHIAVARSGDLILTDAKSRKIWRIPAAGGELSHIAGNDEFEDFRDFDDDSRDGPTKALAATLSYPTSVAVNSQGDIFFVDQSPMGYYRVCRLSAATGMVETISKYNHATWGELAVSPQDELYLSDPRHRLIEQVALSGPLRKLRPEWSIESKRKLEPFDIVKPQRLRIVSSGEIIFNDFYGYSSLKTLSHDWSRITTIIDAKNPRFSGRPRASKRVSLGPSSPDQFATTPDGGVFLLSPNRKLHFIAPDDALDSRLANLVYAALGKTRTARSAQQELELLANPDIARSLWSNRTASNLPKNRIGQLPADLLPRLANYRESQSELLRYRIAFTTYQRLKDDSEIAPELTETHKRKRDHHAPRPATDNGE